MDGSNWAAFKMRFSNAMQGMRCWGYFTGTKVYPDPVDVNKPTVAELAKIDEWEYQDFLASYYLRQKLPDAIAMCL